MPQRMLYVEDVPKRVRGMLAGRTIVDTRRAKMLWESGELAHWVFPIGEIAAGALETATHGASDPAKGPVLHYNVRSGDRFEGNAAWQYPEPPESAAFLKDLVAIDFDKLDAWFEEDDEIHGHPRDPYHRFDCRHSSDNIVVRIGSETIAQTQHAIKLFETSTPMRVYVPMDVVKPGVLVPSETRTFCPYKGEAAYFHVHAGDHTIRDGAWTLPQPLGEAIVCLNHVSFWRGDTVVEVNGERVPLR